MNKKYIIKESKKFDEIIKTSPKIKNYNFIIFYQEKKETPTKYGISVPKKVGKAYIRNKLKRQTRAILRNYNKSFKLNYNCIIIVRNSCLSLPYSDLKNSLEKLLNKLN